MIFSYFSFLSFQINHVCHCRNLQQKNQRHSIAEKRFHCLVVETFHSNPSPYASANSSRCHQHPFRNAPPMAAGFPFVQTVHGESQHVNCNQVMKYDIHEWCMFSCCKGTTIFFDWQWIFAKKCHFPEIQNAVLCHFPEIRGN